jgi:hypothetical protein
MAHAHHSQPTSLPAGPGPGHHASAEDEYLFQPHQTGHEHSDANVWIIVKFGIWLAISAVIIHVGLGGLFGLFVKRSEETVKEFPLAGQEHRLPAGPRLQRFPENEFEAFRQHEDTILHQYGWVNKDGGVVRIPIEEAMKRAVEGGLGQAAPGASTEAAASANATADKGVGRQTTETPGLMPADSSAGRTMERRRQ